MSRGPGSIIAEDVERIIKANRSPLQALEGKSVLVTGGAGFLGAYFLDVIHALNQSEFRRPSELICLDTFISGTPKRISHLEGAKNVRLIKGSITEPLPAGIRPDYILHCASIASPTFYRLHPIETMDANVYGTRNLLDHAVKSKIESMLFFSTSEIYGDPPPSEIPTPETYRGNVSCTGPRACYDESKRFGETLCANFHRARRVPVKVTRPFNVYGPGLRLDDRRVLPDLFSSAISGKDITLLSDGSATRSFCYVSDAIDGFLKILLKGADGEAYNVGGGDGEISMLALARKVSSLYGGREVKFRMSEDKDYLTDNPQRRCPDLSKIRALGYAPSISLDEGLPRLKAWYEGME
ncbi:MAG TPA: NAD-dependent epimerase/dehydratase family protein [Candidatus Bilamarchaeum sp.]|nr:NAD-dependent epimerase/dehydratase family protein [Candidatus Bilamarchaeum sp.]